MAKSSTKVKGVYQRPTNDTLGFTEDKDGALHVEDIVIPPPPLAFLSDESPDQRLIITQLRIKNFKSYAGEIVLGPFNKNFTAVVGPNGSGKSNVIDSLLFVFGYRAKKIRSQKVSQLIHKSDQHPDVTSCTVTVYFAMIKEKDDKYEIIPKTNFSISRTAFIDDTSYYEMNNKRKPYKEVASALRRYSIDLEHSRFLILQGEIEAISMMKAIADKENDTGMLEYLEEIIGTNRYIGPIKTFHEKLSKLNEERREKVNSLTLVEKERDDLEAPKNKALEYLRLQNKIVLSENSLLHYKRFKIETELEELVESKKELVEKLKNHKNDIKKIHQSKKSQEDDLEKINRELEIYLKECEKCKEAFKSLERQDVAMHEEIKHIKTKKSKLESSLTNTKNELIKLKKQVDVHEKETAELEKMRDQLDSQKAVEEKKLSEVMDSVQKETNILQEKKDKLETDLLKMKKGVYNLKSEMELLQSELDIYLRTDKKEKQALSNMISSHENTEKNVKEEKNLLQRETEQISTLETEINSLKQQILDSQQKEMLESEQLKVTRMKYEEARNSLHNFKHSSAMMQAFAKEKASGRLTGIYGRLGDLGAIDEKYDVAISTACGRLNNIVTDTLDTAQQCVEFLKKNRLGYATFIPLDKMTMWIPHTQRKIATPENVPRLFDLVRVKDERVLPAFYYALQNTLVADNLDQASRIGLEGSKRHRVVTLKGDLVEMTGTMSGGGGAMRKGGMGKTIVECTHTPQDVAKINEEVENLSKSVSEIRKIIMNAKEQISLKSNQLCNLQLSIKKRQSNYKAYLASAEMLTSQIEEQKKRIDASTVDEKKVSDLKEKIAVKEKSYGISAKEASAVEEKVGKLQEEILKITKGSMGKVKKTVDQLTKKRSEVSQSITKSGVNTKTCKRNIKKAEEKIKNFEKELEEAAVTMTKLTSNIKNSEGEAREFLKKKDETEAAVEKLKGKKAELKTAVEKFREEEHQLKLSEIKLNNELKEQESVESEKRVIIQSLTGKLVKLKLNEVENDPIEIPSLSKEEIDKLPVKRISTDIEIMKAQLEEISPNLSAIGEYLKKEKLCNEKQKDLDVVIEQRNLQQMRHEELRKRRLTEFMTGYTAISKKLKETYQMLTLGGDGDLELVDKFDPFSKGIEFNVRPPKKSWKFMRNLSGGEKTLSSLALVIALHYYRPNPFYVMDEIDAALDVRNVAIVGYYLKKRTKNTQFIIVSLRNIMNELSDHLIGIFKTNNCSRNVSLCNVIKWREEENEERQV